MTNSFGLESHYHVTRMRALDWSQVQNIIECNSRCHWGLPTIAERSPTLENYTRWKHIPICPIFNVHTNFVLYSECEYGNVVRLHLWCKIYKDMNTNQSSLNGLPPLILGFIWDLLLKAKRYF